MGVKGGFLIGLGVGYVLGTRAGRERYEDIRRWYGQLTGSPVVQRAAVQTKDVAMSGAKKGLSVAQSGVEKAGSAVRERLHRDEDETEDVVRMVETQSGRPPSQGPDKATEAFGDGKKGT